MRMKFYLVILFLILVALTQAQTEQTVDNNIKKNAIYIECFGNSGYTFSLNYERFINQKKNIGIRFGIGYQPPSIVYSYNHKLYSVPVELIYLILKKHSIELGCGFTFLGQKGIGPESTATEFIVLFTRVGYRYTGEKGLIIRIGFTPVIDMSRYFYTNRFPLNPYGGISIGYAF